MPAYKLILPVISFPSERPLPPLKLPATTKVVSASVPAKTGGVAADRILPPEPF